jgi:hypothetical protein
MGEFFIAIKPAVIATRNGLLFEVKLYDVIFLSI